MKRKILHLQLLPLMSGVQRFSLLLLEGLPADEYEIYVACKPGGEFVDAVQNRGWNYIPLPLLRHPIGMLDLFAFLHLILVCKKHKFDIVHTNSSKTGLLGRIAARIAGTPLIIHTNHGASFLPHQHPLIYRLYMHLDKLAGHFCDFVTFVNHCERENYLRLGLVKPEQAVTIYNAIKSRGQEVERSRSDSGSRGREVERSGSLEVEGSDGLVVEMSRSDSGSRGLEVERSGSLVVEGSRGSDAAKGQSLTIGSTLRFSDQKNVIALTTYACKACDLNPGLRFILLGDGEHYELCKAIVASHHMTERILLPGWDSVVEPWLSLFDVFILYSRWEALPFSIIEAMHAGLPVIGSSIPSIMELVSEDVGWLVPLDDEAAYLATLQAVANDPATILKKGQKAREKVQLLCDYDTMVKAYRSLYEG